MTDKCYVRFWDNAGDQRSIVGEFSSISSAENFISAYENGGGIKQFSADIWGAECPELRPDSKQFGYPKQENIIKMRNDIASFRRLYNYILYPLRNVNSFPLHS